MHEEPKRADSHTAADRALARAVHIAWPHDDVRNGELLTVLPDDLILFDLREAVGVAPEVWALFDRTGFIEQSPPGLLPVGVHRERAHADKSLQDPVPRAGFKKIARGDNRVHERIGKRLLTSTCCQVK